MKKTLLTTALAAGLAFGMQAQTTFFSGFENWGTTTSFTNSPSAPTDWMGSKTTAAITVSKVTTGAEQGTAALNVVNTSSSAVRLTTQPVAITQGTAYMVSFYAKGKGSIRAGLYTGKITDAGFGYTYNGTYAAVNSATWHKFSQSVIADTTNGTTAQFILATKSTGTTTGSSPITGIDVDSVKIVPYTVQNVNLHDIQYTTAANGNSPYYGKMVITGGIVTATYSNVPTGTVVPTQSGFYVQSSGSNAWAGALVYDFENIVAQGDSVIFRTGVDEYYNMTELSSVDSASFQIVSHANTLPTPVVITTGTLGNNASEQYEGILVTVNNASCSTYSASYSPAALVDDGSGTGYIDKQIFVYAFTPGTSYNVTGPVNYNYDYSIEPRYAADITALAGIEKYENNLHANVFPNPFANDLNIQLPFAANKVSVNITDMMGREMIAPVATSGINVNVNNLNLAAGTYFVKIIADGKTQTAKIIKQ